MSRTFTLAELAALTGAELAGDPTHTISGVESLADATESDASFLDNPRYRQQMRTSRAGVVFVDKSIAPLPGRNFLVADAPSLAFQKVVEALIPSTPSGFEGIHPTAVIHPSAHIGNDVTIGPCSVVDRGARVGDRTRMGAGVFVGAETQVGCDCILHASVVIRERCVVGNRVVLQPGAVIGSCGYGYYTDMKTGKHTHLKHLGTVILEDDVEIGANTTVDRARFKQTRIARGTKIDNLVQIAHQVDVGEDNLIVSQTGIAGSSKTGRNVVLAGQVGVVGHVELGDGVILASRAAAISSIKESGYYTGVPASPVREYNELMVHFRNLKKLVARVKELEKQLSQVKEPQ